MSILDKLREKKEKRERFKEINRYAEENRLADLEQKEKSELEQERRLSTRRSEITKIRQEKRELNPGIMDKWFNSTSNKSNKREKSYPSVLGSTKKQDESTFSTISQPSFGTGFGNVMGSAIWGGSPRSQVSKRRVKSKPVYVKKGKHYVKVKGKRSPKRKNRGNSQPRESNQGFDIWGRGGIGL